MSDTADMHFQVQGSAALPYRLKAYGLAMTFQMFCDCPAGRRARMMCKHIAALLMGDVTTLVQPSDDIDELARRANGSEWLAAALAHQPAVPRIPALSTMPLDAVAGAGLSLALATVVAEARAMGWIVEASEKEVALFRPRKNGKTLKYPDIEIAWLEENHVRPFTVRSRVEGAKTFAHLERAAAAFWEQVSRHCPKL